MNGNHITQNLYVLSYGDVNASYSPVMRQSSGNVILESIEELYLNSSVSTAIPVRVSQQSEIGSFQIDFQTQHGDEIQSVKVNHSGSPVYFNKISNNIYRVLWYASEGRFINLQQNEPLLWLEMKKSVSNSSLSELKVTGYNEINNGWIQPYLNFRLHAPKLKVRSNENTYEVALYPNPVNEGILYVDLNGIDNHTGTIQITDILGKEVYRINIADINPVDQELRIQTNSWNKGQYHLLLNSFTRDDKPFQISKSFTIR
jgi:hypothetical protein